VVLVAELDVLAQIMLSHVMPPSAGSWPGSFSLATEDHW
jgi:hypothetical protein